jgi:hypothetical protein
MPNLRRLRLEGNRNPHGLFQLGSLLSLPRLEVLTIGGLNAAVSFVEELEDIFGVAEKDEDVLQKTALPPMLGHIIVRTSPQPAGVGIVGQPRLRMREKNDVMMEKLKNLDAMEGKVIKFTLLAGQ